MSGDPLLSLWASKYDVATCLRCGMCECESTCDQRRVADGEATWQQLHDQLISAYNTIEFLHGCLTKPHYSYEYPWMTEREMERIAGMVTFPPTCFHSGYRAGCEACEWRYSA